MPHSRTSAQNEIQTTTSRILILITNYISDNNNHHERPVTTTTTLLKSGWESKGNEMIPHLQKLQNYGPNAV